MRRLAFLSVVLAAVAFAGWFVVLRPHSLGGPATYVMVSGRSMKPALHGGDLVVIRKQDTYASGDVVAFRVGKGIVIHRIVGGSAEGGFVTQGDNMTAPDPWKPTGEEILGEMWVHVPGAGRLLGYLRAPLPLATLAGWLTLVLVAVGGQKTKRRDKTPPVAPSR